MVKELINYFSFRSLEEDRTNYHNVLKLTIKLEKKKKWRNIKDVLEAVRTNYPRLRGQRCLDIAKKAIGQQNPLDQKSCTLKDTIFLAEGSRRCHL